MTEQIAALVALLREGREFALANTRAASVRHALYAWGERVGAALEDFDTVPVVPPSVRDRT